jgi:hypothetical protein
MDRITLTQYTGYLDNYIRRTPKNIEENVKKRLEESVKVQPIDTEEQTIGKYLDIKA